MKKDKDKSLKNEFERKFEEQQHYQQDVPPPAPPREDVLRTESETIPVLEERVHVGKQIVEKGKVLVSKTVNEEEVTIDLPSVEEDVDVERVPVNEYVENMPPAVRYEGDMTIIPVLKEVAVIEKRILLVEEIHIRKRRTTTHDTQQVRLKNEEVNVTKVNPNDQNRV